MNTYDVIVVGGGFIGVSSAYHLARLGSRVLLLEAYDIASGTSGACSGRTQVNEGHLDDLNLFLIREGYKRHQTLSEELGMPTDWHPLGYLCVVKEGQEHLWASWSERAAALSKAGIPTEMLDVKGVQKAEPKLNTEGVMGAAFSVEGVLNSFKLCYAYVEAARRFGAEVRTYTPVTAFEIEGHRVVSVVAGKERFSAGVVAVMCGAWTPVVTRLAGVEVPIQHTAAEAFITEPLPPLINNTVGLADFYETIHGKEKAVSFGVSPHLEGSLLVGEAVTMTRELHRRVTSWGLSLVAAELAHYFPSLGNFSIIRSWGRPTSFTPDEEPIIGWLPGLDNLYTASCMIETITKVPLMGEYIAQDICQERVSIPFERFSPLRFAARC